MDAYDYWKEKFKARPQLEVYISDYLQKNASPQDLENHIDIADWLIRWNPHHGGNGFHWTDIDENAPNWSFEQYAEGLHHPLAEKQFSADLEALEWADTCVLVLPCGRSAHTEAGWMAGAGKRVIAYIPEMVEPELMYKLFDGVVGSIDELIQSLETVPKDSKSCRNR